MINNTKLSSLEETRSEFNPGQGAIKLGIDPQFSLMALDEPDLQPLWTLLANS